MDIDFLTNIVLCVYTSIVLQLEGCMQPLPLHQSPTIPVDYFYYHQFGREREFLFRLL